MSCNRCELCEWANTVCMNGEGPLDAKLMVVLDAPSYEDDLSEHAFRGSAGRKARELLESVGLNPDECRLTYALRCHPRSGVKIRPVCAKECRRHLEAEIEAVKPTVIVTLGALPSKLLTGATGDIAKMRGKVFDGPGTSQIVPTIHPSKTFAYPYQERLLRSDLNYAKALVDRAAVIPPTFKWHLVEHDDQLSALIESAVRTGRLTYDIETEMGEEGEFYNFNKKLLTICVATPEGSWVIPYEHIKRQPELTRKKVRAVLNALLGPTSPVPIRVVQNGSFDDRWLHNRSIMSKPTFDLLIAGYLIDENMPHDLGYMAKTYCGAPPYKEGISYSENEDFMTLCRYNALDGFYQIQLYPIVDKMLTPAWAKVLHHIMMPGQNALVEVMERGLYIDQTKLLEAMQACEKKSAEALAALNGYDPELNWDSSTQISRFLFGTLGLTPLVLTAKGAPSTNEESLVKLSEQHPVPRLILTYRKYIKHLNTFLLPWSERMKATGESRLFTTYKIRGTVTGRLASERPNLQQVPRDGLIRNLVTAPPGWTFIEADFSQIELRIIAWLAQEPTMLEAYQKGIDLHTRTAMELSGKEKPTKDDRSNAKPVNFGLAYGMGAKTLKDYAEINYGVKITLEQAEQWRTKFFKLYGRLSAWHDKMREKVKNDGFVTSPLGRTRRPPNIHSADKSLRWEAERQAINSPVQATASDLMLLALIRLNQADETKLRVVGTVHDAILFEVKDEYLEEMCEFIKYTMEHPPTEALFGVKLGVPIEVEVKVGPWGLGKTWTKGVS